MSVTGGSPRLLYVVGGHKLEFYQRLVNGFAGRDHISVILDRRTVDRRVSSSPRVPERRSDQRRAAAGEDRLRSPGWFITWSSTTPSSRACEAAPGSPPAGIRSVEPIERRAECPAEMSAGASSSAGADDQWAPLTEQDRAGIETIRAQLAREYADAAEAPDDAENGWMLTTRDKRRLLPRVLVVSLLAGALIYAGGVMVASRTRGAAPGSMVPATPTVPNTTASTTVEAPSRPQESPPAERSGEKGPPDPAPPGNSSGAAAELEVRAALKAWVDSMNRAQVATHVEWYADPVPVFYNGRNQPRREALAIRARTLSEATRIEVRTSEPEIRVQADARTATMVFRERYVFEGPRIHRRGTVIQELQWRKTGAGWRIISERTLRELPTKPSRQSKRS